MRSGEEVAKVTPSGTAAPPWRPQSLLLHHNGVVADDGYNSSGPDSSFTIAECVLVSLLPGAEPETGFECKSFI